MKYYPEGLGAHIEKRFESIDEVCKAIKEKSVFEGRVFLCDDEHNLHIDLGGFEGIIPRGEGSLGILENTVKDIALISRVGKSVCFRVMGLKKEGNRIIPVLSRRAVQLDTKKTYIDMLRAGDVISARVTRLDPFGAFIDIGSGLNSLIPIDMLSVSRINHPRERLSCGDLIKTVLLNKDNGKLTFTLKELLGTWEENAALFKAGTTVTGIVRSLEPYGVFVELVPNLAGLAEPDDALIPGQLVSVFIKSVLPDKMKIKLSVVEAFDYADAPPKLNYFVSAGHIDFWQYSPDGAVKKIHTDFK